MSTIADRTSPDPPWWRRDRRGGRQRSPLTREAIAAAAIELIDEDGLAALTIRNLARRLNVGAMTLYWHVTDKDDLCDLVLDAVVGEVDVPDSGGWRERIVALAHSTRATCLRHRAAVALIGSRPLVGPNALALADEMTATLLDGGFAEHAVPAMYQALLNYVTGTALFECRTPTSGDGSAPDLRLLPSDSYPTLGVMAERFAAMDPREGFEFGLQRLLDGFLAWADQR